VRVFVRVGCVCCVLCMYVRCVSVGALYYYARSHLAHFGTHFVQIFLGLFDIFLDVLRLAATKLCSQYLHRHVHTHIGHAHTFIHTSETDTHTHVGTTMDTETHTDTTWMTTPQE